MEEDIVEKLENFIPRDEPRKLAKLASTVNYRRFQLLLLEEILLELRKVRSLLEKLTEGK